MRHRLPGQLRLVNPRKLVTLLRYIMHRLVDFKQIGYRLTTDRTICRYAIKKVK